jgi:hypothetical protein
VVLPLGDSLTRGAGESPSYRFFLQGRLRDGGVPFDFVGTQRGAGGFGDADPGGRVAYDGLAFPDFADLDHEGRSAARIGELTEAAPDWGSAVRPDVDVVLILAGTNDTLDAVAPAQSVEDADALVEAAAGHFPRALLVLGTPPPVAEREQQSAALAAGLSTLSSPDYIIDNHHGFDVSTMLALDGIHLSPAGDAFLAERWFTILEESGLLSRW